MCGRRPLMCKYSALSDVRKILGPNFLLLKIINYQRAVFDQWLEMSPFTWGDLVDHSE